MSFSEQTLGDSEGQGTQVCCSPWGCRVGQHWVTERQQDPRGRSLGASLPWAGVPLPSCGTVGCRRLTPAPFGREWPAPARSHLPRNTWEVAPVSFWPWGNPQLANDTGSRRFFWQNNPRGPFTFWNSPGVSWGSVFMKSLYRWLLLPYPSFLPLFFLPQQVTCPIILVSAQFLGIPAKEHLVVDWLSHVRLFVTPWTAVHQASWPFTVSLSLLKPMSIVSVMPSNHLIPCHPLLLLPWIFPSIRGFPSESALRIKWSKYWSFSFSISPSNEYSVRFPLGLTGLISLQSKGLSRVFSNATVQKYICFPEKSLAAHQKGYQ